MKTLAEAKRKIEIGNKVLVKNFIKEKEEIREVTGKNTVSITTYSPTTRNTMKNTVGADIIMEWQRARDTRIIGNKVQFLAKEGLVDNHTIKDLKEKGIDYWLELEVLQKGTNKEKDFKVNLKKYFTI